MHNAHRCIAPCAAYLWCHMCLTGRRFCCAMVLLMINVKKLNSLKQCLTATRPTSHKNQKVAITFAARRHNVNVLLSNSTFLIFAVLDCEVGRVAVKHCFKLLSFLH